MGKTAPAEVSASEVETATSPEWQAAGLPQAWRPSEFSAALIVTAAELVLLIISYRYQLALGWILLGHLLIVSALGYWVVRRGMEGHDIAYGLVTVIATISTGPLGALGSAIAASKSQNDQEPSRLLEDWYQRISHSTQVDDVTRQCEMVANGRAISLSADEPVSFSSIMAYGTLAQKQSALGLVARKFHPDYLPALQDALKSDQPMIRAQAAAVAAHVRGKIKTLLHGLIGEVPAALQGARPALKLAARIEACLNARLLDEKDRAAGAKAVERLHDRCIDALEFKLPGTGEGQDVAHPGGQESAFDDELERAAVMRAYEALLLRRGRFAEFRALRNRAAHAKHANAHGGNSAAPSPALLRGKPIHE